MSTPSTPSATEGEQADASATEGGRAPSEVVSPVATSGSRPSFKAQWGGTEEHPRLEKLTVTMPGCADTIAVLERPQEPSDPANHIWTYVDMHRYMLAREVARSDQDQAQTQTQTQTQTQGNGGVKDDRTAGGPDRRPRRKALTRLTTTASFKLTQNEPARGQSGVGAGAGADPTQARSLAAAHAAAAPRTPIEHGVPDRPMASRTELPPELMQELNEEWELVIDHELHDPAGNAYTPLEVERKTAVATLCGGFPHAIVTTSSGMHSGKQSYVVGGCHEILLDAKIRRKGSTPHNGPLTVERTILNKIKAALPADEVARWGRYESSLIFHARLVFQDGSSVRPLHVSEGGSFSDAPKDNQLLFPHEKPLGYASIYEQEMQDGALGWVFSTNRGVTSAKLAPDFKGWKFALLVEITNPYIKSVESLSRRSEPFLIKSVLGNDLASGERYVKLNAPTTIAGKHRQAGEVVPAPGKPRRQPALSQNRRVQKR